FKWRGRYWSFLLKLSPDMPSWTIQARRSNNMGPFHWRNRILRIGEIDLIAGGPPCPPFSKSRFYRKDMPRALDDPNGWETINGYLRMLDWVRPRTFILENVKGLAYKVHADALETIIARAEKLGYKVSTDVLNAANFGVPQIRERCFVVGSLDCEIALPQPTHSSDPVDGRLPWVTAGVVLADLDTEENASDERHFAGGQHHGLLRQVPPGDNYLFFTEKRGHRSNGAAATGRSC
ncbi:MAG: DNA cytosine methyltransferase, partial [Sphingomonas sp.]|nr:DNA cytosine methyltransferase [Sphingomonas sp.]